MEQYNAIEVLPGKFLNGERDENLEVRLTTDPHSHSEARTNAVVRNFDVWHEAFGVGPGAGLYLPPEERVRIW